MTTAAEALKPIEAAVEAEPVEPPPLPNAPPAAEPLADSAGDAAKEGPEAAGAPENDGAHADGAQADRTETSPEDNAGVALPAASVERADVSPEPGAHAAVEREAEPDVEAEEPPPPRAAGPLFLVPSSPPAEAEPPPALPAMATPSAARVRAAANPLLAAAGPVMAQARRLSEMEEPPVDPAALGFELSRLLAEFEVSATAAGLPAGAVQVGRFALAATLDDLLRARPWAGQCLWLRQGLAASGPERFFDLMRAMLKTPPRHRQALELFYACLSLGFEGRFRDRSQGGHELARIRDQLYRVLRRLTEAPERALSPAPPQPAAGSGAYRPPPRAVSPAAVAFWLILFAMLGWFAAAWVLHGRVAALSVTLGGMISEQNVATARPAPLPPPAGPELAARVTEMLAPDIRANAVEVLAGADGALVVRLSGGAVFPAGSDAVRAFYRAVIDRVGLALAREQGRVLVVAHTDAWALATDRFPNARTLTEARAEAVRALLEKRLGGLRLSAEGRGDGEPIDSNDTPAGRAANRRVDIRLYP